MINDNDYRIFFPFKFLVNIIGLSRDEEDDDCNNFDRFFLPFPLLICVAKAFGRSIISEFIKHNAEHVSKILSSFN